MHLFSVGGRSGSFESSTELFGRGSLDSVCQGKLNFGVDHFNNSGTFGTNFWILGDQWAGYNAGITDLNGGGTGTVSGTHFCVQLFNSTAQRSIAVFFVHIVTAGTRVVTKSNTVDVDNVGVGFVDFTDSKNITGGLFHFAVLVKKVPETRFSLDWGSSKNFHAVNLWIGIGSSGGLAASDLVLVDESLLSGHDVAKNKGKGRRRKRKGEGECFVFFF